MAHSVAKVKFNNNILLKQPFKMKWYHQCSYLGILFAGVFMCMHWEEKRLFVTSRDVHQSSPLLARVNTLVLSAPDCPITHYAWPPYTQLNADTFVRLFVHRECML